MDNPGHFGGPEVGGPGPGPGGLIPLPDHILSFLSEEERRFIPEPIHSKLKAHFGDLTRRYHNTINDKQKLRISYEEHISNIQKELKEHRERSDTFNSQLSEERTERETYVKKYQECLRTINDLEESVRKTQSSLSDSLLKIDQITAEKDELLILTNKRNTEIQKLNTDISNLSEQLQSATLAKIEALVKVDELTSKELELDYKEKQLAKDKGWIGKQVGLLNEELDRKNNEIIQMQREFSLKYLGLQTDVSEKGEKLRLAELQIENLKSTNEGQEKHIERLIEKLKEAQDMEIKMEETYRQELKSQKRIADLYKDSSEEASKKIDELEDAVSNLQDLLRLATERYGELESTHSKTSKSFQDEVLQRDMEIERLTKELSHANELLSNISKKGLTDEMISNLSPAAAAATQMLRSSSSLTEIYSKYQSLKEELLQSQIENEKLNQYVEEILKEVEVRAPILKAQREDYERALQTIDALSNQLDLCVETENKVKEDYYVVKKERDSLEREKSRLKSQLLDSSNQIKVLVREIEVARGTYTHSGDLNSSASLSASRSNLAITDSSTLISERLVTFRNIDELQAQNQYLLSLVRELSEEREKLTNRDEASFDELKSAFEQARKELEELRELRVRQDANFKNLLEQRDRRVQQAQIQTKSTMSSPIKMSHTPMTPNNEVELQKIKSLETKLAEITDEYETYKREKKEHERISSEQMEKLRDDLTRLRTENAKLSSQTEYNNERAKIYTSNLERYKKSIEVLEEKNKQLALTSSKYEQNLITLKSELTSLQQKLSRAEMNLNSITNERNMLRDSKSRLQSELEMFKREKSTEKILQLNLADIKNNLELNNSEIKLRYESTIEKLESENTILRRRVDSEDNKLKATVFSWDKINKDLEAKLEKSQAEVEGLKRSLDAAGENGRKQREEIDNLLTKISILTGGAGESSTILSSIEIEKQTKELSAKLSDATKEIKALKQQLEISKDSLNEYKNLCKSMEEQIQNSKESELQAVASTSERASENEKELIERLGFKDDIIRDLQAKVDGIEKENFKLKADIEKVLSETSGKSTVLEDELNHVQRELEVVNSKLQSTIDENTKLKTDLEQQILLTKEFQIKYTNELNSHSNEEEQLRNLKSELDSLRSKVGEEERGRHIAEEKLKEFESNWSQNEKSLREELSQALKNVKELDDLNSGLQDQLVTLTTQMSSLRSAQSADLNASMGSSSEPKSLDVSFSTSFLESQEQSEAVRKTTDQWMQLIRYMRQQKEIAYSKTELANATVQRLEAQLQYLQKQYDELKSKLDESQQASHFSVLTSAKQAELLRKVETLSALTDSNRLLREEKDNALSEITDLRTRLASIESQFEPLKLQNLELESKLDSISTENESLKQDLSRWRSRAADLLEKSKQINPEEWKKLNTEKDGLVRQVQNLTEANKKHTTESQRLNLQVQQFQRQIATLQTASKTSAEQTKSLTEELKKIQTEKAKVASDLETAHSEFVKLRAENTKYQEELNQLKEQNVKALADVEENKALVRQVKNIARKYKKSAEDSDKEIEDLKKQLETASQPASTPEPPSAPEKADASIGTDSQMEIVDQTDSQQQIEANAAEVDGLKRDLETVRTEIVQKDERAKLAIRNLQQKANSLSTQKSELETELQQAKQTITTLQTSQEENSGRLAALRSQYEGRINRLEKEIKDLKDSQQGQGTSTSATIAAAPPTSGELAGDTEMQRLKNENEMQRQRILALEKQFMIKTQQHQAAMTAAALAASTAAAAAASTPTSGSTSSSIGSTPSPAEQPPKANIKPIAGGTQAMANAPSTSGTPPQNRPQPTASIRPMSMTRKATVMPTTQPQTTTPPQPQQLQQQQQSSQSQQQQSQSQTQQATPTGGVIPQHTQGVIAPVSQAQVSTSTPDGSNNNNAIRQATVQPTSLGGSGISSVSVVPQIAPVPGSGTSGTTTSTTQAQQNVVETGNQATVGSNQEGPSTSSSLQIEDTEMGDSQEQVSSSEPSSHQLVLTVAPLRSSSSASQSQQSSDRETQQSNAAESQSSAQGTSGISREREEPSPSTSVSAQRATPSTSKRTRETSSSTTVETSDVESPVPEPESKRVRLMVSRPVVDRSSEAEAKVTTQQKQTRKPIPAQASYEDDDDSDVIVLDSDDDEEEPRSTPATSAAQTVRRNVNIPTPGSQSRGVFHRQNQPDPDDEDVVDDDVDDDLVDVEEDEEGEVYADDEEMEDDEEEVDPEEEVDEDEGDGNGHDEDDDEDDNNAEADESFEHGEVDQDDEGPEDVNIEDGDERDIGGEDEPMEGREAQSLEPEDGEMLEEDEEDDEREQPDESEENQIEEIDLVDDDEAQEAGEASPAVPPQVAPVPESIQQPQPQSSSGPQTPRPSALPSRPTPGRQERLPSYGRQQQLTPSFQSYAGDEGDDSIVPSTPTLFVPRRSDGFAEAVSSPQIPSSGSGGGGSTSGGRFTFNTNLTSSSTDTVEDTRLNLMGYEEGNGDRDRSGRSVPSTPLNTSPPAQLGLGDQDQESLVSGREDPNVDEIDFDEEDEERRGDDSHPSSSFASVPSITITAVSGSSTGERERMNEQELDEAEAQRGIEIETESLDASDGQPKATRPESSAVTSSDETEKSTNVHVSSAGSSSSSATATTTTTAGQAQQAPSTSSSPYRQTGATEPQTTTTTRARPKPIVWDQPTSSSSSSSGSVHPSGIGQQPPPLLRGSPRGGRGISRGRIASNVSVIQQHLQHANPQQPESARGLYRPMQSARRSRPRAIGGPPGRGSGLTRGPRPPY